MKEISLGRGLSLSAHAFATNVVAALGMRGSGKSNSMTVAVEGLLEADVQVVVLDYVGIWFGLRLLPNGKPSKFEVPVLGGRHGDIPLVAQAGRQVAEALASSRSSAVLDISGFSKADRIRFAADFGEAFFEAKKSHSSPVFVVLEEAQRFVPQVMRYSDPGLSRCLGAFEEIAEVGRNYGIGLGLISQRPQKINKDVLNLAELVFAFQTNGVLERKAIAEWVQEKGAEGRSQVTGELPSLPRGSALVWSPSTFKLYGKFSFHKKSTYDAGATPEHVRADVKVKALDLKSLEGAMAAVVREAKESDPRALRAEIQRLKASGSTAALEREVGQLRVALEKEKTKNEGGSLLRPVDVARLEKIAARVEKMESARSDRQSILMDKVVSLKPSSLERDRLVEALAGLTKMIHLVRSPEPKPDVSLRRRRPLEAKPPHQRDTSVDLLEERSAGRVTPYSDGKQDKLGKCPLALLRVIVQLDGASDRQIAGLSGYRKATSTFENGLTALRKRGFIEGAPNRRTPTSAGRQAAGAVESPPTGPELLDYWLKRLNKCQASMLEVIYKAGTIDRASLSEKTRYRVTTSTFENGLTGLRKFNLVSGPAGGDLTIAEVFRVFR